MKKILFVFLLSIASLAHADRWRHGSGQYYYHPSYGWVAPAIIGGAIGYSMARPYYYPPAPYYYIPQPIVIQQQPTYMQQPYPAVTGYHQETITDANCNCLRTVLVPNQ